jgi:hypothetical protein
MTKAVACSLFPIPYSLLFVPPLPPLKYLQNLADYFAKEEEKAAGA